MCIYFYLHVCIYKDTCILFLCMIDSVCVLVFLISEPPPFVYTCTYMDTCFVWYQATHSLIKKILVYISVLLHSIVCISVCVITCIKHTLSSIKQRSNYVLSWYFGFLIRLAMLEIMMFWGMTYIDAVAYRGSTKKGPYPDSSNCCRPLYSFWLLMWRSDQYSCRYHILSPGNSNMLYVRIKRINALFLYPVLVAPDHRFHPGRYPKTQKGFLHDSS